MPKVSIIVPIYNGEKVIRRCVDSIINQDYRDLEIILVDDGSKDDSYKIIEEYAKNDERIVPVHKENSGVSATRNLALSMATGDYIRFLDVDDWLPFDSTKLMVRAMEENDVDLVIADFYRVVGDNVAKKGSIKEGGVTTRNAFADKMMLSPADFYYGVLWNKLYKKQIIDSYAIRMDQNISYGEDMIYNLEYLLHVERIYVLKNPVYYYVRTEGSLVMQNMNLESTIKMKTGMIKYYRDFYKNITVAQDYEQRKPFIYGYLVAVSTDSFAIPFLENTKKLGEEKGGKVYYDKEFDDNELMNNYLRNRLFLKMLNPLAEAKGLRENEMMILYYLYKKGKSASGDEIASVCSIGSGNCAVSLAKLLTTAHLKVSDVNLFDDDKILYEYVSGELDKQFDKIQDDYLAICFNGVSEEDLKRFTEVRKQVYDNIRKTLINQ